MLRFIVNDIIRLEPDLKNDFQFLGNCPQTKKPNGLILNELKEVITLPFLNKSYIGYDGLREFEKKYKKSQIRVQKSKVSEIDAKKINSRLREIAKNATREGARVLKVNEKMIPKFKNTELEINIFFYISSKHRLYHPGSDNILCSFSDISPGELEFKNIDFNDGKHYKTFRHCFLFHDLIDHKHVNIQDLLQVDCILIDYDLKFQNAGKGFMK